jgi:hypothetical protein
MPLTTVRYKMKLLPALGTALTKTDEYLRDRIETLEKSSGSRDWSRFRNFWPPTTMKALREEKLIFFMGAGTSAAAGLPTWRKLLEERFGIPTEFLHDENLKNDNLTLGEIASRLIGREQLQSILRAAYDKSSDLPTAVHFCLAALELPVYITTNYDTLFEKAWRKTHGKDISIICNASDAKKYAADSYKLFKIHGSAGRVDELLVLTRSEYRRHYRVNSAIFDEIRTLIQTRPTVFTGFSHTDPEIGRLIDDVIFHYEQRASGKLDPSPDLFNIQFENDYVTTERFAAKGMVSLNVRLVTRPDVDPRTGGVCESIAELVDATYSRMDDVTSVDDELGILLDPIRKDLDRAIDQLKKVVAEIATALKRNPFDMGAIAAKLDSIDRSAALATQGLYLVDSVGDLIDWRYDLLDGLAREEEIRRTLKNNFRTRPYFQASKSFRRPFVSDFFKSVFNEHATFAICVPITENDNFMGLLFSACQIGQWDTPIKAIDDVRRTKYALGAYILDNQGMVAAPPNKEFLAKISPLCTSEPDSVRIGFNYTELKILSRKDRIVSRLAENIVPVQNDDDVFSLDKELEIYARIANVGDLGWRCAVTRTIRFTTA